MKIRNTIPSAAALALLTALAACSETDKTDFSTPDDGSIRFAANTEYNSRAGDVTTANLTQFNVYAYTGGGSTPALFMDNVKVSKTSSNTWTYSPLKFWPAENVDFYAYAPESWVGAAGTLAPVKYTNYDAKTDLVYAVAPGLNGNGTQPNAQVIFNFRHALSKVTVFLSSSDTNLKVDVTNVALANIKATAEFTFPKNSTGNPVADNNVGTWSNYADTYPYMLHMSQTPGEVVTLTTTPVDLSESGLGGPKFLIPQILSWRSNGAKDDNYIMVMCSVYDAKTGTKLWPNANTPEENIVSGSTNGDGLLKFPLSTTQFSAWKPGYHYIYNLVINANSEMGSIEFGTPTVDSYVDVQTSYN